LPVDEDGKFSASLLLYQPGTYQISARSVNLLGVYSEPTTAQQVVITGTGPVYSKDASLAALMVDGQLIAGFAPNVFEYYVTLPSGTTEVPEVSAIASDSKANVKITQAATANGVAVVVVTAEDGITRNTYSVYFNVASSNDATLKEIKVNGADISGFDPGVYAYTVKLPYGTTVVPVVSAAANDINAIITVTQAGSVTGTATIRVVAADGITEQIYIVKFIVAPNTDANVSDLKIDGVTIDGFDPSITNYNKVLPYGTTVVPVITATATDANATVTVTQAASLPGTAIIQVTAADRVTTKTYTIRFTVAANTDASLRELKVDGETVEGFDPLITDYDIVLPYGTTEVPEVTATTNDANATVTVTQAASLPGTATIQVTAAD